MWKKIKRNYAAFATTLALAVQTLSAATPGQPQLSMTYELTGERGEVVGVLTAPLTDTGQQALPDDLRMEITVYRSAYSLGQNNLVVEKYQGMTPGETVEFVDHITPAWELNQDYTYTAEVVAPGYTFYTGYSGMNPGLDFMFSQNALTLTPTPDGKSVELRVVAPSKMTSGTELQEPMTALEFYRAVNTSSWPYQYELLYSYPNPEPDEVVTFTDPNPTQDKENYYRVRAVTKYGFAETQEHCYVGFDIPAAPYPVTAVATADGALVSWTAPDRGENWGVIDPAETWYNVYRCRGYGTANRELIASRIYETSFTDTGADLTEPLQVRYEVQAGNSKGEGGSNYSSYEYDIIVGPAYSLPFRDTFDGGFTKVWQLGATDYWARWYEATVGEYGERPVQVRPVQGSGLIYVDYIYNSPASGATNSLTSYKLDLEKMENPWVSFWYYAIPDNDVTINFAVSENPAEFSDGQTLRISQDVTAPEWRKVYLPMKDVAGVKAGYMRLSTSFTDVPSSAILDDVAVMNYPFVSDIKAETDEENMTVTLTWDIPVDGAAECKGFIGYVDGVEFGEVESPWVYEGLELDREYAFSVRPLYEGVEVEASAPCVVMVKTPAPDAFTVGDYDYVVLDTAVLEKEVYISGYHGKGGFLRLPASVGYAEETYSVRGVAEEAFAGNADVESVTMPEGYTVVMRGAFHDDIALSAVSFPASLLTIDDDAFAGCTALSVVNFAGSVPPAVGNDAFKGIAEGCRGYCPEEAVELYYKVENLSGIDFGYKDPSGINELMMRDDVTLEWFDFAGRKIVAPVDGEPCIVRITLNDGTVYVSKRF